MDQISAMRIFTRLLQTGSFSAVAVSRGQVAFEPVNTTTITQDSLLSIFRANFGACNQYCEDSRYEAVKEVPFHSLSRCSPHYLWYFSSFSCSYSVFN